MSEQTNTTQATETQAEGGQEQAQPDMSALMSRMDELSQTVQSLKPQEQSQEYGGLSDSFYGQQEGEQQGQWNQQDYEIGQFGDQFDGMDPQAQQQAAIEEANKLIDARVQEALNPIRQQYQQDRMVSQAKELEQKYPDLQKGDVVGPVMQEAQRRAQAAGQPDLVRNPAFIELVYLAQQATTNASQQTAADGGSEAHLEGEGAVPDAPEDDFAQRVVNAGSGPGTHGGFRWT